jgi:GTP-binding protein
MSIEQKINGVAYIRQACLFAGMALALLSGAGAVTMGSGRPSRPQIIHTSKPVPMSQFPDAKFILSANAPHQFVADTGHEVAVAGRSNAGKSSAINVIVNRRQFARTSKTPGRTQLVNFFELSAGLRLVDLPGYGFARVAESVRQHWGRLLVTYFEQRKSLSGLMLVVDVRRELGDFDRRMLEFAASVAVPVHVLLTKADKLKRGKASAALLGVQRELGDAASVQLFSALDRQGLDEARAMLDTLLAREPGSA